MPTIVAWAYKYSVGQPFVYPKNSLDYASNFLNMCFSVPADDYVVDPILSRAMDRIFTLHADHEQNASTSTVRLASSSGANPFACIAAGVACLWGPAHGGANEACLRMLREIGTVDRIPEYIAKAKDKNDPFRLMGFGHRVYKNFDPRAKVMKQSADEVLGLLGIENNPTLQVAKELERIALEDPYFIEKKLYPNVDFYSGIILDAMGFPTSMFTPIFALARTVGWISAVEGDAGGPAAEDRPAAAALHRRRPSATTWMSRGAERPTTAAAVRRGGAAGALGRRAVAAQAPSRASTERAARSPGGSPPRPSSCIARSPAARCAAAAAGSSSSVSTAGAIAAGVQSSNRNSGTARLSVTRLTRVAVSIRTSRRTIQTVSAVRVVGDHHRRPGGGQLQADRSRGGQRHVGGGEGGALARSPTRRPRSRAGRAHAASRRRRPAWRRRASPTTDGAAGTTTASSGRCARSRARPRRRPGRAG